MYDDLHVDIQVLKITMKRPSFQDTMLPHNSIDLLESQSKKRKITIVQDLNPSKSVMGTRIRMVHSTDKQRDRDDTRKSRDRHDTVKWRDIMIQTNRETDMTQANKGQRDNWVSLWKT
jgi:hypothetical protein